MTMNFDIPADVQALVADIPDLDARVALFLRHEAQLESIRQSRHSSSAREVAKRALHRAAEDKATGFDWATSFDSLKQSHQAISEKL